MNDLQNKKLRSLGKVELLRLLRDQEIEIERLTQVVAELERNAAERNISLQNAGSIAEASIQISKVFAAAQESADVYLSNVRQMQERCKSETETALERARQKADEMLAQAERKCAEREAQEKQFVDEMWDNLQDKLKRFCSSYSELGELVQKINIHPVINGLNPIVTETKND